MPFETNEETRTERRFRQSRKLFQQVVNNSNRCLLQSGPKIAEILMQHYSATICSRITQFSLQCSGKITVYESMQNLHQFAKIFFDKQPELDTRYERRHLHVNPTPLSVEDRLLIKTSQTEILVLSNGTLLSNNLVQ